MKKLLLTVLAVVLIAAGAVSTTKEAEAQTLPLPVKVLLLPKFEIEEMSGDFPGEAQYYYEQYLMGAEEYDVPYSPGKLYYKDGIAMCVLGMGKINAALSTMAILSDTRFDCSEAYINTKRRDWQTTTYKFFVGVRVPAGIPNEVRARQFAKMLSWLCAGFRRGKEL